MFEDDKKFEESADDNIVKNENGITINNMDDSEPGTPHASPLSNRITEDSPPIKPSDQKPPGFYEANTRMQKAILHKMLQKKKMQIKKKANIHNFKQ